VLIEMLLDDLEIFGVGFPEKVKSIPYKRYCADSRIKADIGHHPGDFPLRQTEIFGFPDNIHAHGGGREITHHGYKPDDGIQPDTTAGAGDYKHAFEQLFKRFNARTNGRRVLTHHRPSGSLMCVGALALCIWATGIRTMGSLFGKGLYRHAKDMGIAKRISIVSRTIFARDLAALAGLTVFCTLVTDMIIFQYSLTCAQYHGYVRTIVLVF
jgi:hypothetical protein